MATVHPQSVIATGLAVALVGLVWQFYYSSGNVPSASDNVGAPSPPLDQTTKPSRFFSLKEKNDLIDAYRLITTNLEQKGRPAIELSRELEINWSNWDKFQGMGIRTKKQEAELASRLQKTLDDLDAAIFKDLLNDPGLMGLHQEIQLVLGSRAPLQSFRDSAGTFAIGLSEIEKGDNAIIKLLNFNRRPLEENKIGFASWITECNSRIDAARKNLNR